MLYAFPMSTDVVNPAVRDAEMLTANLAVRLLLARSLAITQSNVLVYSALKFDPLLDRIRFFAGLIPGDDLRFAILVGFIKLYSRLDYLYLYYSVYIQALNYPPTKSEGNSFGVVRASVRPSVRPFRLSTLFCLSRTISQYL